MMDAVVNVALVKIVVANVVAATDAANHFYSNEVYEQPTIL